MEDFQMVVKGALLHDIGKLIQRSEENPFDKTHGQWGYEWLKNFFGDDPSIYSTITHHSHDEDVFKSNYSIIWYEADNIASSERKQEGDNEKGRWDMYTALTSPFFKIRNPNNLSESLTEIPYLQLKYNGKIKSVSFQKPDISFKTYEQIRKDLENDLNIAKEYKPYSINFLLMLFEKHLSNVPSITLEISKEGEENIEKHPDISLFSHSKLAAAVAGCLYHFMRETYPEKWKNNELLKDEILNPPPDVKPFLLIGGDISGVQKFIYTITSKGALRSLKGRSFYLELLTEHVISELLDALKLTRCNIIFAGGGRFYLLSHNTPSAIESILSVGKRIDEFLFNEFKGNLQIHIAYVPFRKEFFKNAVPIWREISTSLELLKRRKWEKRLYDVLKVESQHEDCFTESCEVCFREDAPLVDLQRVDDTIKVCNACYSQYQLGSFLTRISKADYPVIYKLSSKPADDFIKIEDWFYEFKTGWDRDIHNNAKAVYRINDFNAKHYSHENTIYVPAGVYQHESIQELSDATEVFGISRIAVLRMDVDNLGKIFSSAVPEDERTFSRMASISKGLNEFFKKHLNEIVEGKIDNACDIVEREVKEHGRKLSIVYSGGDDLFIIGHWLDVLEAAFDINECFKKYTGNKFITLSGGVAINEEHYPVYQFARDAQELEEEAKDKGKNSLVIFLPHLRFDWDSFKAVIERVKLFSRFLRKDRYCLSTDENKLPKTFFYRLFSLAKQFREKRELILPKAAYLISRARFRECNSEDILKLKEVIMNVNEREWRITEASTLITLMLLRKGGK